MNRDHRNLLAWFRRQRRWIAMIAALTVMSLALVQFVCPWPLDGSMSSSVVPSPTSLPSGQPCGPEGCTYAHGGHAVPDQSVLTASSLSLAVIFFLLAALPLAALGPWRARSFRRLPGYPPILEFYRLRI